MVGPFELGKRPEELNVYFAERQNLFFATTSVKVFYWKLCSYLLVKHVCTLRGEEGGSFLAMCMVPFFIKIVERVNAKQK